jgi:hypothetical protein
MIKASTKVGRSTIHIEADGFKKLMLIHGFLNQVPEKCGNCGSDNIVLNGTKNAGYEFYGCLCKDCKHELKCGQRKEDGGLFWKIEDGWAAPYQKEGGGGRPPQQQGGGRPPADDDDDIPF